MAEIIPLHQPPHQVAPPAPVSADIPRALTDADDCLLSGWGRTSPSTATLVRPSGLDAVQRAVYPSSDIGDPAAGAPPEWSHPSRRQVGCVIARGLGRSYGDAAQCAGGLVIDMAGFGSIGPIDPSTGLVTVGGGVSLAELNRRSLPLGWFVPVTPGTRHVTVGGAVAADVHGKNHHQDGAFCSHLAELTLVSPTGTRVVGPDKDPELFWATAGGMGLTGVVVAVTIRMLAVETAWLQVENRHFANLDQLMAEMVCADHAFRYSVAWVDTSRRHRGLGRSILTRGDHATAEALARATGRAARTPQDRPRRSVPTVLPRSLVGRHSVRAFNELWYRRSSRRQSSALEPLTSFFYPLDRLADWNRLYGPRGFVQYQFAVGPFHAEVVRQAVEMAATRRIPSSLAVLKRFGPADPGPLSFPMPGWTLALDFPAGVGGLPHLLDEFDSLVAGVGGRVYLAKDARLRPELLSTMYPRRTNSPPCADESTRTASSARIFLVGSASLARWAMDDAFGSPQSVVVLGGTSDIAGALLDTLVAERCRAVVLAGRDMAGLAMAADRLTGLGASRVETVVFDATDPVGADEAVAQCFAAAAGPVDLVVIAVGRLGDSRDYASDPSRVVELMNVNVTWPASAMSVAVGHCRAQGRGRIVVFSSVAAVRTRPSTFVYGSAKAGLDGFARGLAEAIIGSGVSVHVVRPGFVRTKMTAGRRAAPFAVDAQQVADEVARGIRRGQKVIWAPGPLRWVYGVLGVVPAALWRRLPS